MQSVVESNKGQQPMLTIAIPTYNRAPYLELCLRRIREELDSLSGTMRGLVKVYISNNASTDNTAGVIATFLHGYAGSVEIVSHKESIGGELNVTQCYLLATSSYVWVLGDDDVILPEKLNMVLNTLINNNIDILYVNNYWFKESYLERPRFPGKNGVSIYENALKFASRTNVMLTFISGLIVRTGIDFEHFSGVVSGTRLSQLGWVLPLLRDGKCFGVIEDTVVAAKGSNSGGYELVKVFGENLQRISNVILKDRPELAKAIENGTIVNFFPGFVMELRSGSSKFQDKNMADGFRQAFGGNWRYYIFLAPLIAMPLYFRRLYYYFVRLIRLLIGPFLI